MEEVQVMRIQLRLQRVWREVCSEEGAALVNKSQKEGLKEISIASWQGKNLRTPMRAVSESSESSVLE